jgi:CO/xanthine dehydrogenase Mo-binding subunit
MPRAASANNKHNACQGWSGVGAGEPTCAVVASAIGRAIFEATGVRLRSVPFAPAKVKAALGA